MIETPHGQDCRRRVPVYSLYSDTREPTDEMLDGLDVLVVDLQDVGTRVYTYIYTMANCMRAAARRGLPVVVCDSNSRTRLVARRSGRAPAGGLELVCRTISHPDAPRSDDRRAGPPVQQRLRHRARLDVVMLEGWRRSMFYDETGLPWIIPSPNIPTLDSAVVYPGAVLVEGTKLSEGRGTTRPFEFIGAPWIDGERLAATMNARGLPGVHFRPVFFEPTFQKHARQSCGGCQIHVLDRRAFAPLRTAVEFLDEFRREDPARFAWQSLTSTSTTRNRSISCQFPARASPASSPAPYGA